MANTYLQRTVGTPTSAYKGTLSWWQKITNASSSTYYFLACESGNERLLWYQSNGAWQGGLRGTSSPPDLDFTLNGAPRFRDCNAWYHCVLAWDTTLSTGADRIKFYVNNNEFTVNATGSSSTIPQNHVMPTNKSGLPFRLGSNITGGNYFDGIISHLNFVDGEQLTPSSFGETDANGVWKIIVEPSVTYGNNGFFILKDGNSVTDQSGNTNNFTVGGGTLTNTEDSPSNVFATGNPLGSKSITFSNGNNTVTNPTASPLNTAIATLGASSGKYYAEFKATSIGSGTYDVYTGFVNLDKTNLQNTGTLGDTTDGAGISSGGGYIYYNGTQFAGPTTATTNGDIVNLAMDLDNGRLYWGINGTYVNSGNPASGSTGTGGMPIANITAGGTYTFAVGIQNGATINLNFGNGYFGTTAVSSAGTNASGIGIFEYDVPTGYTALSTKGLNL